MAPQLVAADMQTYAAAVVLACRSMERGERLQGELQKEAAALGHADAKVEVSATPDFAGSFIQRGHMSWALRLAQWHVYVCIVC